MLATLKKTQDISNPRVTDQKRSKTQKIKIQRKITTYKR